MTTVVSSRRSSYASNASSIELPDYGSIVVLKRTDGKDGAVFPIEDNTVTFGKHEDNDIRINRPNVDEHHAILSIHEDLMKVEIHNLSKIHSIKVGSFMIRPKQRSVILGKDIIEIADRRFRFEKKRSAWKVAISGQKATENRPKNRGRESFSKKIHRHSYEYSTQWSTGAEAYPKKSPSKSI
mmetsp:Transcript_24961/g.98604  ORF Transcript_24961/g.98604 Transcript_24961/m.98604 type:complete len:183 (-) Transcript_24961:1486-2034(-)